MALAQLRSAALIALLVAGLSACGGPGPAGGPPSPKPAPTPQQAGQPSAAQRRAQAQLQQALTSAEDLFNRGENDLACEQVQRAEGLRRQLQDAPAAGGAAQLDRFSRACAAL